MDQRLHERALEAVRRRNHDVQLGVVNRKRAGARERIDEIESSAALASLRLAIQIRRALGRFARDQALHKNGKESGEMRWVR